MHYCNTDFWASATARGGASGDNWAQALKGDFKDLDVFNNAVATKLLIMVHENGGNVLGYRKWQLTTPTTLRSMFNTAPGTLLANKVASSSEGGETGTLHESEPMVRNTVVSGPHTDELWINTNSLGHGDDWNRMTVRKSGDTTTYNNVGWGLGTQYDSATATTCNTARPFADAQMHTRVGNWGDGDSGGIRGMIGSDQTCNGGCPWSGPSYYSGYDYDYAIFVLPQEPRASCSC